MVEQYIYLHVSICEGEWDLDKYGSECDCLFVYQRGCLCSSFIFFVFFIIVLELLSLYPPLTFFTPLIITKSFLFIFDTVFNY